MGCSYSSDDADILTPPISELSLQEIHFIQATWEIPSAKVSHSFTYLHHYHAICNSQAQRFCREALLRIPREVSAQSTSLSSLQKHAAVDAKGELCVNRMDGWMLNTNKCPLFSAFSHRVLQVGLLKSDLLATKRV